MQFIDDHEVLAYVKGTDSSNDLAVITVFLENGGGGGACLPVAGGLIRFLSGEAEIEAD